MHWVLEPLFAAGLDRSEIASLLYRFTFSEMVTAGHDGARTDSHPLREEPLHVRAAWLEVVGRILTLHGHASS